MRGQVDGQLTLYLGDFHANHSPQPGSDEARKMTVISGQKCSGLCRNSNPLGLLVRTLLESSTWHSTHRFLTWKPKDTPSKRLYFQLVPSAPRTSGTGLQFWPTPKASDYKGSGKAGSVSAEHDLRKGNLKGAIMYYATQQSRDCRTGQDKRWEDRAHRSRNLNDQIAAMYPTPTGNRICGGAHAAESLHRLQEAGKISKEEERSMKAGNGGQLNPMWVEWLMGFPIGWTDLSVSETQ